MSTIRGALIAASLVALHVACAGRTMETEPPVRKAAEAELRVVNRTSSDVRIEANARSLGEVRAGGEQLFVGLPAGSLELQGASLDGSLLFRRDRLTLEPGETFTWILRQEDEPGAAPAGETRRSATIVVENHTDWDVEVVLDDQILGATSAGATGRFGGILPGPHRLEARSREASFPQEFPALEPGEVFTWRLRAPGRIAAEGILPAPGTGRLRVENPHPQAITMLVNGAPVGSVQARSVRIFDNLAAARVLLAAESEDGRTRFTGPSMRIDPGRVTSWRVGAGEANDLGRAPEVAETPAPEPLGREAPPPEPFEPGAQAAEPFEPGEPVVVEPAAPAALDTLPAYPEEREPALPAPPAPGPPAGELTPAPDEDLLELGDKVFIVENHTSQDLEIFFDGVSAGAVGAGMTERFTRLPGLRFTPSAVTATGKREFRHPLVDLSSRQSFSWIIEP